MAIHSLSLQVGSVNTSLITNGVLLLDYNPTSPSISLTQAGGEVYDAEKDLVTETVRLWVWGETGADVQAKIATIEQFLELSTRRQKTRTGDRGYLHLRLTSDSETWRSEVVSGQVQADQDALRTWDANGAEVVMVVTRRYWWETKVERELPLDNTSAGSKATGGVTIYNHDDATAGHDNWVDVAAVDVAGSLPAPARIRLTNSYGSAIFYSNFYQSNNAFHAPTAFTHVLEGEAAAGANTVVDANSSNGNFGRAPWTTSIVHTLNLFTWTLSNVFLAATGGGFFRVLVRFATTPPTNIELQLHVKTTISPVLSLWDGPKMTATGNLLQDLGVVQLPPGVAGTNFFGLGLVLTAAFTGTNQLDIDFVQLTPANSTRWFKQIGYQIPNGDSIENNGPEDRVYEIDAATGQQSHLYEVYSGVLYVWPNRDQRFIFLHDHATGMLIAHTGTVRIYYRPRRLTL